MNKDTSLKIPELGQVMQEKFKQFKTQEVNESTKFQAEVNPKLSKNPKEFEIKLVHKY